MKVNVIGEQLSQQEIDAYIDYGKKKYGDLDEESKAVVDSFEGEKEYRDTTQRANFYSGGGIKMLAIK